MAKRVERRVQDQCETFEEIQPVPGGYAVASKDVMALVESVIDECQPLTRAAGVTVCACFKFADIGEDGESKGPALKAHGVRAYAKIRKTSLQQRVQGMADAEITIDGDVWPKMTPDNQRALIDHELTHLMIDEDAEGKTKIDKAGRPKLSIRPHDWELTGFSEVVQRRGAAAIETKAMVRFVEGEDGQMLFKFGGLKLIGEGEAAKE